jgi:hypothetical protein
LLNLRFDPSVLLMTCYSYSYFDLELCNQKDLPKFWPVFIIREPIGQWRIVPRNPAINNWSLSSLPPTPIFHLWSEKKLLQSGSKTLDSSDSSFQLTGRPLHWLLSPFCSVRFSVCLRQCQNLGFYSSEQLWVHRKSGSSIACHWLRAVCCRLESYTFEWEFSFEWFQRDCW